MEPEPPSFALSRSRPNLVGAGAAKESGGSATLVFSKSGFGSAILDGPWFQKSETSIPVPDR